MVSVRNQKPKLPEEVLAGMQQVLDALFNARDADDVDISALFHDLLPRRDWPDYYKLIKHPQALNPVQNKVKRKSYHTVPDFVKDCAQIFHNAKIYNRHGSEIYSAAETLEGILKKQLEELAEKGIIPKSDTELPDLGPLPPPSPTISAVPTLDEPSAGEEEDEEDEEEEEEDDDDDDGDDDDEGEKKRRPARSRARGSGSAPTRSSARKKSEIKDEDVEMDDGTGKRAPRDDPRRRRGRPPRVDTPMEMRIKNILKALRRLKDDAGNQRIMDFDKLPEKKEFPEYYVQIRDPMAVDIVRKNIKRREYKSVEQFLGDMELMFENAKIFNEEDSDIYKNAVALQEELRKSAEIEKARTDEELAGAGEDGEGGSRKLFRIPLDKIEHKGEIYRVGDWIHIVNPNDPNKPTVAQVFRTWKDSDGQVWINACWYYRPEQTVHWVEKKFYQDEVVKTGQYRDHHIDEVLGKCFVMFFTRYSRGRPKGLNEAKTPVYVCESRYNENERHFNKIKTWKSCIPDEVRGQDYELDPFEKQRTLKKMPSPIAHLLPANAKEGDPLPEAKMGVDNAPPIIGAVFKRARRETDSPPPEPTPPPQPPAPVPAATPAPPRVNPDYHETMSMTQMYKQAHLAATVAAAATPPHHHTPQQTPAPSRSPMPIYPQHQRPQPAAYTVPHQHPQAAALQIQQQQAAYIQQQQARQQYHPPAPPTTFTLPESVTHNIPEEIASKFLRDANGQLLWFTVPPIANERYEPGAVGHSVQYLAKKKELEERRKRRREEVEKEQREAKRMRQEEAVKEKQEAERIMVKALGVWTEQLAGSR